MRPPLSLWQCAGSLTALLFACCYTIPILQLQKSFIKWLVFTICVWVKSFWMKHGTKHDKVCSALLLGFRAQLHMGIVGLGLGTA
jgi:hypothetical protein